MARTANHLFVLAVSLAIATTFAPALARAQTPTRAEETRDREARARFESGRLAFEAGRYEEALADFTRSHELSGRDVILFNIGLVHDRLRRDAEALDAFERYLAAVPDAENRAEVEARIAVLRRTLARESEPEDAIIVAPAPAPTHHAHYEIGGWLASGLTIATAVTAGALWALASDEYAQLEASCGEGGCARAQIDASGAPDLVTGTNVMLVSAIISGLCAAAAWTLYFVDTPAAPPSASSPVVRVGPGSLRIDF